MLLTEAGRHIGTNLMLLVGIGAVSTLVALLLYDVLKVDHWEFGLLNLVVLAVWAEFLIYLLALDFTAQYLAHGLLHRYRWLWKLHIVHHSDRLVDASAGTRLHPADFLLREILAWTTVAVLGIPIIYHGF